MKQIVTKRSNAMLDRIASFLTGIMCFLYLINFTVHKHVKIGEKYIKFDDAGSL